MIMAIYTWCSGTELSGVTVTPTFEKFSSSYTALFLFVVLTLICSKKDLKIFMRIGSFGVVFVILFLVFIMAMGFIALGDTSFVIGDATQSAAVDWTKKDRILVLFNTNFAPLCGVYCSGFFLHTCALPIVRSNKEPKNNKRDVFLGFFMVYLSYVIAGTLGYIGFMGIKFKDYFINVSKKQTGSQEIGQIDQNCLNMFPYDNVGAFVLRTSIFFLLFSTYPLVNFFLKTILKNLWFRNREVSRLVDFVMNVTLVFIPLLFALFYPNIGTLLAYVGAVSGFLVIFVIPIMVHLKQMRTRITNPLLAEALATNEFQMKFSDVVSPKIELSDALIRRSKNLEARGG